MKRSQCKDGLEIYKRFLTRMTRVSEFFKIAEVTFWAAGVTDWLGAEVHSGSCCLTSCCFLLKEVGIDKNDIPELTKVRLSNLGFGPFWEIDYSFRLQADRLTNSGVVFLTILHVIWMSKATICFFCCVHHNCSHLTTIRNSQTGTTQPPHNQ